MELKHLNSSIFLTFPACFHTPNIFSNLNFNCSNVLELRNLHVFMYRVGHKFSDTWNELLVVNWFISKFVWGNTEWKKVSSLHYLKILMKLSKKGISYSLKRDRRSISKITFYANLSVSPLISSFDFFKELHYSWKIKTLFNKSIQLTLFRPRYCWLELKIALFLKNYQSSVSIGLTLKLA